MSKFTPPHKPEPPSLFCGKCRQWVEVSRKESREIGMNYWECPRCDPPTGQGKPVEPCL